jgi:hypothetical protein
MGNHEEPAAEAMEDEAMLEIGKADRGTAQLEGSRPGVENVETVAQRTCCLIFLSLSWVIWSTYQA